jgi:lipopolysaccharide transport system permease protein
MLDVIKPIYSHRSFIWGSIKRDFQSRYQSSFLGALWLILQPLSMIAVYTIVFSNLMKARLPGELGEYAFSIYLCSGLLTWGLFSEVLLRSRSMFIENSNLLKKQNFPRVCLPIIVSSIAVVNFVIIFSLFILFLILIGKFNILSLAYMIPILILQLVFSAGLGFFVGLLNVFVRDVGQFIDVILQLGFWATPIVYSVDILPESFKKYIYINPMARIIHCYQEIFLHHRMPDYSFLTPVLIITVVVCLLGYLFYLRCNKELVDEL